MIKIHDNRTTNERRLDTLDTGDFFIWNDLLCRNIGWINEEWAKTHEDNYAVMIMTTGEITDIDRSAWVEPVSDKKIFLSMED